MQPLALPHVAFESTPDAFKARRPELAGHGVEFKGLQATEIKADRAKRRVELWIAGYGNVDLGGDLVVKGAAARTIKEDFPRDLVKFYWNHDFPLGPAEVLEEHSNGLLMVSNVTDHPDFDKHLAQIEDGTASHGSLGLSVRESEVLSAAEVKRQYRADAGNHAMVRVIKEMRVWEGSAVIWPMNEMVRVVQVKDIQKGGSMIEKKSLWDLADAVQALATIRMLTRAEWAELDDEELEAAQQLLTEMAETTEKINAGVRHRETKHNPAAGVAAEITALIEAAKSRASTIENLAIQA